MANYEVRLTRSAESWSSYSRWWRLNEWLGYRISDCITLGNDRFLVNGVRKRSFPIAIGFVRNCAQYFLQAFARVPNRSRFARRHSDVRSWLLMDRATSVRLSRSGTLKEAIQF